MNKHFPDNLGAAPPQQPLRVISRTARASVVGVTIAAWVFALEYSLYLVGNDFADKAIKLGAGFFMLYWLKSQLKNVLNQEKILMAIFAALLLTTLLPSALYGDTVTGVIQWLKFALMTSCFPLLLINRRATTINRDLLMSLYVWSGVIFSIQAIVAFIVVATWWGLDAQSELVQIGRRPDTPEWSMGILGYANAVRGVNANFIWLRPQGWFLEPSVLGAFLLLPVFVSLGKFLQSRTFRHFAVLAILAGALVLTISFAAYIAVVAAVLLLIFSKPAYRVLMKINRRLRYGYPIVILVFLFGFGVYFLTISNQLAEIDNTYLGDTEYAITAIFSRRADGPSGNVIREMAELDRYTSILLSNPLGIGFGDSLGENDTLAANALLFWIIAGGLPAAIAIIGLFAYIFVAFLHPLLLSSDPVNKCLAASFVGHVIHNLSYGNWMAPYFLIHLVLVCMYAGSIRMGGQSFSTSIPRVVTK